MARTAGKLVLMAGTGTGIGKTHVSEALLLAWRAQRIVAAGVKPVESGVDGTTPSDGERLGAASAFHVKPPYALRAPLAPCVAARDEEIPIEIEAIHACIDEARAHADVVLLELPGGLFSPLTEQILNADFAVSLKPHAALLVAPDRLGVLHDVLSTLRAAASLALFVRGVLLVTPEKADLSTGRNAAELAQRASAPVLATIARATPDHLAITLAGLARALLR